MNQDAKKFLKEHGFKLACLIAALIGIIIWLGASRREIIKSLELVRREASDSEGSLKATKTEIDRLNVALEVANSTAKQLRAQSKKSSKKIKRPVVLPNGMIGYEEVETMDEEAMSEQLEETKMMLDQAIDRESRLIMEVAEKDKRISVLTSELKQKEISRPSFRPWAAGLYGQVNGQDYGLIWGDAGYHFELGWLDLGPHVFGPITGGSIAGPGYAPLGDRPWLFGLGARF